MGNIDMNACYSWRFRWMPLPTEQPTRVQSVEATNSNGPEMIYVGGTFPLDLTLQISGAEIFVEGGFHHVSILGSYNTITINGSDIVIRVQGEHVSLKGNGRGVILYADIDTNLPVGNHLQVTRRNLRDEDGNVVAEAPQLLEGQNGVAQIQPVATQRPDRNVPTHLRCTWRLYEENRPNGGGGGGGAADPANQNQDLDSGASDGDDDDDEDDYKPGDGNDVSRKRAKRDHDGDGDGQPRKKQANVNQANGAKG